MLSVISAFLFCGLSAMAVRDDTYEPNDVKDEAYNGLADGVWLSELDGLGVSKDEDWFRIDVSDALNRRIQIECLFTHDEGDIDIVLYDDTEEQLSYEWTKTDNECIDYVVPKVGTYYVKAALCA